MILEGKTAIVYGAGGSIGSAAAMAFAREGATVHLTGRTVEPLYQLAERIRKTGGDTVVAQVDALDEEAVDDHAESVARADGGIDIAINLISHNDVQGRPFVDMSLADYEQPVTTALRTTFLTWRAVGRHMKQQGSGVILAFGGEGDPLPGYSLGGLQSGFGVVEAMRRQVACQLGPHGVRVVTLRTSGVMDTIPVISVAAVPAMYWEPVTGALPASRFFLGAWVLGVSVTTSSTSTTDRAAGTVGRISSGAV